MTRGTFVAGPAFSRQSSSTARPLPAYTRPHRSNQRGDGDPGPSTRPFSSRSPSSLPADRKRLSFSSNYKSRPPSSIPLVSLSRPPSSYSPRTPRPPKRHNPYANMTQAQLSAAREALDQRDKKRTCCEPGDFCYDNTIRCFWPLFALVAGVIVMAGMLGGFYRPNAHDPCPIPHTTLVPVPPNVKHTLADSTAVRKSSGFIVAQLDLAQWVNGTRVDIEGIMESVGIGVAPTRTVKTSGGNVVAMAAGLACAAMVVVSCLIWIGGWVVEWWVGRRERAVARREGVGEGQEMGHRASRERGCDGCDTLGGSAEAERGAGGTMPQYEKRGSWTWASTWTWI